MRAWLAAHPRFQMHFTPVHGSWMNPVEQGCSILQRTRLVASNFADLDALRERVQAFITEWHAAAHPFNWTPRSFDKILAKVDAELARGALPPCVQDVDVRVSGTTIVGGAGASQYTVTVEAVDASGACDPLTHVDRCEGEVMRRPVRHERAWLFPPVGCL